MCCSKCCGLVIREHEEYRCLNCGNRPFEPRITVKCAAVECRQLPELNGYCSPCWRSRKRSELTDQERSKRYRERMREKQRNRRARKKGASNAASLHDTEHELPRLERDHQGSEGAPDGLQQPQEAMG